MDSNSWLTVVTDERESLIVNIAHVVTLSPLPQQRTRLTLSTGDTLDVVEPDSMALAQALEVVGAL